MKATTNLTEQIKAQKVECGVPDAQAHAEAVAVVEKKVSKTQLGIMIAAVGIAGGITSSILDMSKWLTFGSLIGGCLWGASTWSGELLKESLKGFGETVAGVIKAIKGAFTGGAA